MAPRPHRDEPSPNPAGYREGPQAAKRFQDAMTILANTPRPSAQPVKVKRRKK